MTKFANGSELAVAGSPDVFGVASKKVIGCDVADGAVKALGVVVLRVALDEDARLFEG